jgi:hypothetical protein
MSGSAFLSPKSNNFGGKRFGVRGTQNRPEQIPPKSPDFGDKDLLQHIELARILIGEVIPLRRDTRWPVWTGGGADFARQMGVFQRVQCKNL